MQGMGEPQKRLTGCATDCTTVISLGPKTLIFGAIWALLGEEPCLTVFDVRS